MFSQSGRPLSQTGPCTHRALLRNFSSRHLLCLFPFLSFFLSFLLVGIFLQISFAKSLKIDLPKQGSFGKRSDSYNSGRRDLFLPLDMSHSHVWHNSVVRATWLIHMCDTTHSYVRHDSVYRRIHICDVTYAFEWHDSTVRVTWFHMCVMTHSYVWNDLFIHATWFIHTSDMFDCHVCNDSFIYVTWLHHICAIAHLYVCHNSFILVTRFKSATSLVWHDSFIYAPRRMVFCFLAEVTVTHVTHRDLFLRLHHICIHPSTPPTPSCTCPKYTMVCFKHPSSQVQSAEKQGRLCRFLQQRQKEICERAPLKTALSF